MEIILNANKDTCSIVGWQSNTGEVAVRTLTVELSEEMCQCAKTFVTFELADGTLYESLVVNGKANIPTIDKAQFIKVGAYSADIEGEKCVKRYSPHPTDVYVNAGSYSGNGVEAPKPTVGTYEELTEKIGAKEDTSNKVTEIDRNSSDIQYPSAKAVVNYIDNAIGGIENGGGDNVEIPKNIETTDNKVTAISENSTDAQYPSAKAVYDYVQSIGGEGDLPVSGGGSTEEWVELLNTNLTEDVAYVDLVAEEGKMFKKLHIHINTGNYGLTTVSKVIIKGSKSGAFNGNNSENLVLTQNTITTYSNTVFFIEKGSLFPLAFSSMGASNGTTATAVYMGGVTQLLSTNTDIRYVNAGPWKTIRIQPQTADVLLKAGVKIQIWGVYE